MLLLLLLVIDYCTNTVIMPFKVELGRVEEYAGAVVAELEKL